MPEIARSGKKKKEKKKHFPTPIFGRGKRKLRVIIRLSVRAKGGSLLGAKKKK